MESQLIGMSDDEEERSEDEAGSESAGRAGQGGDGGLSQGKDVKSGRDCEITNLLCKFFLPGPRMQ
jgi:hypothetical protein